MKLEKIIEQNKFKNYLGKTMYFNINGLNKLIDLIINDEHLEINSYFKITPFYENDMLSHQLEFDLCTFYIEKNDKLNTNEYKKVVYNTKHPNPELGFLMTESELSHFTLEEFEVMIPNSTNNIQDIKQAILKYKEFLNILISKLYDIAIESMDLNNEEKKAFGYFSFEVHGE